MTHIGQRVRLRSVALAACLLQLSTSVCAGASVVLCLSNDDHAVIELALAGEARCSDGGIRDHCLSADDGSDCGDVPLLLPAQTALVGTGTSHRDAVASAALPAPFAVSVVGTPPGAPGLLRGHAPPGAHLAAHLAVVRLLI